jgi:hypothetical protein
VKGVVSDAWRLKQPNSASQPPSPKPVKLY